MLPALRGCLPWIAAGVVGACYSPRPSGDCEVICSTAAGEGCPDGFACGASGLCSAGGNACAGDRSGPETCFGDGIAKPCVPVPPGSLMLSGTINTDADPRCTLVDQPARGPQLCVIAGEQLVIGKPVRAVGSRPLVLAASDTLTVSAMLDGRSLRGEPVTGAGASPCPPAIAVGEAAVGAGGAGGSFQGSGGGGSGGLIVLEAPAITFSGAARLLALGGGGAGGGAIQGGQAGGDPDPFAIPSTDIKAVGGQGGSPSGGKGGDGSPATPLPASLGGARGVDGTMDGGGGGGGGGAGFIMLLCKACAPSGVLILPPPMS